MAENPVKVRIGVSLGEAGAPDRFTADFAREMMPLQT